MAGMYGNTRVAGASPTLTANNSAAQQISSDEAPAPPQLATSPKGAPTSFWARLAQTGASKVRDITRAAGRPLVDVVTGQGGKAVHDVAQLSSDVTGGTANQFARGVVNAPIAAAREIRNKPITDIQKNAFGTTNPGNIAKKIVGSTVGTASIFVGGGEAKAAATGARVGTKALLSSAAKNAVAGTAGNVGSTVVQNPNASGKELVKSGAVGGLAGIGLTALGKVFHAGSQAVLDKLKSPEAKAAEANKGAMSDVMTHEQADKVAAAQYTQINVNQAPNAAEKVNVTTPLRPGIKQVSETSKINVRTPVKMTDDQFHTEFKKLSDGYTKETRQLQSSSKLLSQKQLQVASDKLEAKYQGKLNDLQDRYSKPQLSPQTAPKKLESKTLPAEKTTGGKVSTLGGNRPNNELQTQIEKAHNAGDNTTAEKLIKQLPDASTRDSMRSSVGLPTKETKVTTVAGKVERVPIDNGDTFKVSGSALKSEQRAVEKGLAQDFEDKTTYTVGSHKTEAASAVKLTHENPQRALDIAMGKVPGNNVLHEVAVRRAVENKAIQEGDVSTLRHLATSKQHTATSEAAQRLGAEGYHVGGNNAVEHMRDINAVRAKAYESKTGEKLTKAINRTIKEADAHVIKPTKETWESWVASIKC